MQLPGPRTQLAKCVWLPRIIAKARALARGELPPAYQMPFCHQLGVDGQFLSHFGLTREDIVRAAEGSDEEVASWFSSRPGAAERIRAWNHLAVNLGRPGFPMAERLPTALSTTYKNVDPTTVSSVFEILEADEGILTPRTASA